MLIAYLGQPPCKPPLHATGMNKSFGYFVYSDGNLWSKGAGKGRSRLGGLHFFAGAEVQGVLTGFHDPPKGSRRTSTRVNHAGATQESRGEREGRSDRLLLEPGPLLSIFDSMLGTAASRRLSTSVGG